MSTEMPEPRQRTNWNFDLAGMGVGDYRDCGSEREWKALHTCMRYRKWTSVRRTQPDGKIRVWRYS